MSFGKSINRLVSKLNLRGRKIRTEKAEFISSNALFLKALNKDKRELPKLNKKLENSSHK